MPEKIMDPKELIEALSSEVVIPGRCNGMRFRKSLICQLQHLVRLENEYWALKESVTADRIPTPDDLSDKLDILRTHNLTGRPVLHITRGAATERQLLQEVLDATSNLLKENQTLKRYLRFALEDFRHLGNLAASSHATLEPDYYVDYIRYGSHEWRYAEEVYPLLEGGEENGNRNA